jgi:hypothetical protein
LALFSVHHILGVFAAGACLLAGSATASGCRPSGPPASSNRAVTPEYDQKTGRLQRIASDSNHDGKIDTWGYMDGMRLVRVEVDEDGDGAVDRWEFYSETAAAPAPGSRQPQVPERIERATRHDGKVSRWEYFENGTLARVEEDTDGDGQLDKWETYRAGTLAMLALDTEHRGKPNRRLIYKSDGSLDRIEADSNGSGEFRPMKDQRATP